MGLSVDTDGLERGVRSIARRRDFGSNQCSGLRDGLTTRRFVSGSPGNEDGRMEAYFTIFRTFGTKRCPLEGAMIGSGPYLMLGMDVRTI